MIIHYAGGKCALPDGGHVKVRINIYTSYPGLYTQDPRK